jgi:hypothetical protein
MTNAQHTPGPWIVQTLYDDGSWHTCKNMAGVIFTFPTYEEAVQASKKWKADGDRYWLVYRFLTVTESASRELLEALQSLAALEVKGHALISRLQFSDTGRALAAKVDAAIAKATGNPQAQAA